MVLAWKMVPEQRNHIWRIMSPSRVTICDGTKTSLLRSAPQSEKQSEAIRSNHLRRHEDLVVEERAD